MQNFKVFLKQTALAAFFFLLVPHANAQDRIFSYTYQSNVLHPGEREIEPWSTFRWGKKEFFRAFDQRLEFELGIAKNVQTSFYINISTKAYRLDSVIATVNGLSFSNEWKLKISDPVADPFGFALYGELGIGRTEIEWENKLIFDKKIGATTLALNLAGEVEFEKQVKQNKTRSEKEFFVEADFGISHSVTKGLNVGLEIRNHGNIEDGRLRHGALFAGPTLSYYQQNFWMNLTILPQIAAWKGATSKGLDLIEHERLETRLIFSFAL